VADEKNPHLVVGATGAAACLGSDFVKVNYAKTEGYESKEIFKEAARIKDVFSERRVFIAEIVDHNSLVGQKYLNHQNESFFYKIASFFSVDEVVKIMRQARFTDFMFR
jgi:hypothetical protein